MLVVLFAVMFLSTCKKKQMAKDGPAYPPHTANLCAKTLDFRGFDASRILRVGVLMSAGNFPEASSRRTLVEMILAGRLGAHFQGELKGSQGRESEHRST